MPQAQIRSQHAVNLFEIAMDGAMRIADFQASALWGVLRAQGRAATMFGVPDWSRALAGPAPDHLSKIVMAGAHQNINLMRHTNETLALIQQQVGQLMEQQVAQWAEQMREGVDQASRRTEQSLEEFRQTTQQTLEEMQRTGDEQVQSLGQAANEPRSRRRA